MPLLLVLSVVLQFCCLVHMVKTGRPYWWIWVILIGSYLGVAVYVVTQVVPDLRNDPRARRAARGVVRAIDPARERRRIENELAVADTVQNRMRLGREVLALGDAAYAEELFASCLKGPHATDPDILLALAHAQFERGDAAATRRTLDTLIAANPSYESTDGHLLYARALETLGESDAALHEYETLARSYPGEEARWRYGDLLVRQQRHADARRVFDDMLRRERAAPAYYRRKEKDWLAQARSALAKLGPASIQ